MINEQMLSIVRGIADTATSMKLGIRKECLQDALDGYCDEEFLSKFKLDEDLALFIKNELGTEPIKGIILAKPVL